MGKLIDISGQNPFTFYVKKEGNRLLTQIAIIDRYGKKLGAIDGYRYEFTVGLDLVDYDDGRDFFEVLDRNRDVIFGMKFEPPNIYPVHGYFYTEKRVVVGGDSVTVKNLGLINQLGFSFFGNYDKSVEGEIAEAVKTTEYFNPSWKDGYQPH